MPFRPVLTVALILGLAAALAAAAAAPQAGSAQAATVTLTLAEIEAMLDAPGAHDPFEPDLPLGLLPALMVIPEDNPLTPAKVELGRQLYFDTRLSRDHTVSCATCHHPTKGWTDRAITSTGIDGQRGSRSAPTVMNRLLSKAQFWDGRAPSLEAQALGPIENPVEMGFTHAEAVERLNGSAGYRMQFARIFGGPATPDRIGKAIAAFERTVLTGGAPNDYYEKLEFDLGWEPEAGEDPEDAAERARALAGYKGNPLSDAALRGRTLYFGKARCDQCHLGANLTDEQYHNIGVDTDGAAVPDPGRQTVSGKDKDWAAFKTPTLRNVVDTAPYMHDGSEQTLLQVVKFYNGGGKPNQALSEKIFKLELTDAEQRDLVTFLEQGLTGLVTPVAEPRLPE